MAAGSGIEWTEATWNPVTGCTKISAGCLNCYAERMSLRLQAMGQPNYRDGFALRTHEHMLGLPLTWKQPRTVFVNSMSDLFHESIPEKFIHRVFDVMHSIDRHRYQILTKRSERLLKMASQLPSAGHIWIGVSIENEDYIFRANHLRRSVAAVKFLSLEPLLGPVPNLSLDGIDWVIVGGESGPKARPMNPDWVRSVRDQCQAAGTPFFFKQWGGRNKKKAGRLLDGRIWSEMPLIGNGSEQARVQAA
jgi:protein gp37